MEKPPIGETASEDHTWSAVPYRVHLSPAFQAFAGDWSPAKCLRMAKYFADLARQLDMRGRIAYADQAFAQRRQPRGLRPIHARRQRLN